MNSCFSGIFNVGWEPEFFLPNVVQEGDYEMKYIDRVGEQSFNVAIAPFSLSILGDSADAF